MLSLGQILAAAACSVLLCIGILGIVGRLVGDDEERPPES
jgi:hypothetical protein